mgnify:CR=1 FL=1
MQKLQKVRDHDLYNLYLFDIQTDTTVTINTTTTLAVPALIEGSRSGAKGYLKTAVSGSADLVVTQTSGQFVVDEPIIINGVQDGKVIRFLQVNQMEKPSHCSAYTILDSIHFTHSICRFSKFK